MPEKGFSLPEISVLLALVGEAREISNPDLKKRYGLTLEGKSRRNLNDLKLVDSWRQGRAYVHVLTDDGWARLADELREGIALPTGSAAGALRALLGGLHRYLERTNHSLADVFAPDAESFESASPFTTVAPPITSAISYPAGPPMAPVPDIEARIRAAYIELAGEPGVWVSLTRLRPLLGDVPKAETDDGLRRLELMTDVNIVPESNQKILSEQDREAAVIIGDQFKHLLWIGAR